MGNTASSPKKSSSRRSGKSRDRDRERDRKRDPDDAANVATRAQKVVGESVQNLSANLQSSIKKLEEDDHPAAQFLDSVCGGYLDPGRAASSRNNSFYSEDYDDETISEVDDETTTTTDYRDRRSRRARRSRDEPSVGESVSYGESDVDSEDRRKKKPAPSNLTTESYESEESSRKHGVVNQVAEITANSATLGKPLASSFAKRCYFTKAGIGKTTQHYEGLTLTGNVVLMLAAAMKLKGCPTICDEDLRRVEQTYPNQFSRLPDELLLSSGWRRISKYCHFSNKPIPDGVPFFHSKQRLHPSGGYYFLLAAAVGMVRPIDVEPLSRDTLVLLETDYPTACDSAPRILIEDPIQWTLVDKFCFFSGGPINTEEDVYYQADFDGNPIFMLAFLSPSLTPEELYKLDQDTGEPGLKTTAAVEEVESVYDLTERDFDDLRLYHLGPCRALPPYVLQPVSWTKVLPPHFLAARQTALLRAQEFERHSGMPSQHGIIHQNHLANHMMTHPVAGMAQSHSRVASSDMSHSPLPQNMGVSPPDPRITKFEQTMTSYGQSANPVKPVQPLVSYNFSPSRNNVPSTADHIHGPVFSNEEAPMDEAMLGEPSRNSPLESSDPPEDEPPSLSKRGLSDSPEVANTFSSGDPQGIYGSHMDPPTISNLAISSTDDNGESYEETEFYENNSPPKNDNHDYYGHHDGSLASHLEPGQVPRRYNEPQEEREGAPYQFHEPVESQEQDSFEYNEPVDSFQHADYGHNENTQEHVGYSDQEFSERLHHHGFRHDESTEPENDESFEVTEESFDGNQRIRLGLPPTSPQSQAGSEHVSHTSSAMRGAQELLKRNRQKRLEMAARRAGGIDGGRPSGAPQVETGRPDPVLHSDKDVISPQSATTWESSSEVTSVVSGTSSAWTDGSTNADRSSRRALILQMAKARMKKNNPPTSKANTNGKTAGNPVEESEEEKKLDSAGEEENSFAVGVNMVRSNSLNTDIDIAGDLD